jgi:hypothetical protein
LALMPNRLGRSVGLTLILGSESVLTKSPGRLTSMGIVQVIPFGGLLIPDSKADCGNAYTSWVG